MNQSGDWRALDGRVIANFVLDFCEKKGRRVTHLSLQKIVYFCHVWFLIELKRPLIRHQFEAWQHGPVLQYLYREFSKFDKAVITERATELDPFTGKRKIVSANLDQGSKVFLERIIDFYSSLNAGHLVYLSHIKGGPWDQVWNHEDPVNPGMKIQDRDIVEFYSKAQPRFTLQ